MTTWHTLELHTESLPALVQMSALRAAGIEAFIDNYHHASVSPHMALALGGFRVVVSEDDLELAQEVVAQARSHEIEATNEARAAEDEVSKTCPKCESTDIFRGRSLIMSAIGLVGWGVPLPVRKSYRQCRSCRHEWQETT